jgi:hypothetical protein
VPVRSALAQGECQPAVPLELGDGAGIGELQLGDRHQEHGLSAHLRVPGGEGDALHAGGDGQAAAGRSRLPGGVVLGEQGEGERGWITGALGNGDRLRRQRLGLRGALTAVAVVISVPRQGCQEPSPDRTRPVAQGVDRLFEQRRRSSPDVP